MRKTYSGRITYLKPNQYWVFGSNTEGRHGKGSALFAVQKCGAIYGQSIGWQGQSYAICTKDLTKKVHPSVDVEFIQWQIGTLYHNAFQHPEYEFIVAYSGTGVNLNGYSNTEMAFMFQNPIDIEGNETWKFENFQVKQYDKLKFEHIPENIIFEKSFHELIFGESEFF